MDFYDFLAASDLQICVLVLQLKFYRNLWISCGLQTLSKLHRMVSLYEEYHIKHWQITF
jgi:hypothetical protein